VGVRGTLWTGRASVRYQTLNWRRSGPL